MGFFDFKLPYKFIWNGVHDSQIFHNLVFPENSVAFSRIVKIYKIE